MRPQASLAAGWCLVLGSCVPHLARRGGESRRKPNRDQVEARKLARLKDATPEGFRRAARSYRIEAGAIHAMLGRELHKTGGGVALALLFPDRVELSLAAYQPSRDPVEQSRIEYWSLVSSDSDLLQDLTQLRWEASSDLSARVERRTRSVRVWWQEAYVSEDSETWRKGGSGSVALHQQKWFRLLREHLTHVLPPRIFPPDEDQN